MPLLPLILALHAGAPHLAAARAASSPVIDGRLDDAAWTSASATDAFTQKLPNEGSAASERTRVRVLYDDDAVYIGVECTQTSSPVVAAMTRRDRSVEADSITIDLDTRRDGKTAFTFGVNAAGVLSDGVRFDDTDSSTDWDENWRARVARTSDGWSAELLIPLQILRFDELPVQDWGLQVRRRISARQETDEWSFIPRDAAAEVSRYGRLEGLRGLRSRGGFELRPFVLARMLRHDTEQGAVDDGAELEASAGLDLKWHPTQRLTLDGTVNPDFGQVEADGVVLNLSSFETYLPEKRPFFIEGFDMFSTPLNLLYTRRIGHAADSPSLPDGEELVDTPQPAPIYGATKLVGELGGGFSIGQIVAVDGASRVETKRGDGARARRVADPLTTFQALRVKRAIGDRAEVGVLLTSTNRLESSAAYPTIAGSAGPRVERCPGGEEVARGKRCTHDAYVGGVDARWRSGSGDYAARGQLVGSVIEGGPPRTMPDGTTIASGDASQGGQVTVAKEGGGHLRWSASYSGHGRRVDYNDMGYMRRQNEHSAWASVEYQTHEPVGPVQDTTTGLDAYHDTSLDLLNLGAGGALRTWIKLKSFWSMDARVDYEASRFDDRAIGDGTALERTHALGLAASFSSDPRGRVQGYLWGRVELLPAGVNVYGSAGLTLRVMPELDLELGPDGEYRSGEPRFVETDDTGYLFGRLRAESLTFTARATYTFTPELTMQAYAQAFLAAGHYSDFLVFQRLSSRPGDTIRLADLAPAGLPASSPDFEDGALNASVVTRWEYRLGSTFFFVYSHSQSSSQTPVGPGAVRFRLIDPRRAADVFVAKLSYWWG